MGVTATCLVTRGRHCSKIVCRHSVPFLLSYSQINIQTFSSMTSCNVEQTNTANEKQDSLGLFSMPDRIDKSGGGG